MNLRVGPATAADTGAGGGVGPDDFARRAKALRPFYFIVVLWGERFRSYFLNFCLPTLLAPGNIPSLLNRGNKFVICTTTEDWAIIQNVPIFELLKTYVEPVLIEIPWPDPNRTGCEHMGVGHKPATQMAHRDQAYGVIVTPDFMLSDGSVAALQRHAVEGKQVVLNVALRFGEEPLFYHLEQMKIVGFDSTLGQSATPLSISGRQMLAAGLKSFHSEVLRYEYDAPYFTNFPCACWWKVPGEDGIVIHSFSWGPLLLDYSIVEDHYTTVLETWTLDANYVDRNFGHAARVHIVQDSDEMIQVSWAPLNDRPHSLAPERAKSWPIIRNLTKGAILRETFLSPIWDPLKRRIFPVTVRWHVHDLNRKWKPTEKKALATVRRYISDEEFGLAAPLRAPFWIPTGTAGIAIVKGNSFARDFRLGLGRRAKTTQRVYFFMQRLPYVFLSILRRVRYVLLALLSFTRRTLLWSRCLLIASVVLSRRMLVRSRCLAIASVAFSRRLVITCRNTPQVLRAIFYDLLHQRHRIMQVSRAAMKGDKVSMRRIRRRFRILYNQWTARQMVND